MVRKPSQYFLDLLEKDLKKMRAKPKHCEVPGCPQVGEYRAPKSNQLNDYYNFCLHHVKEYNTGWDYFSGMPESAVEHQMYNDMMWDRPTWNMAPGGFDPDRLQRRIYDNLNFGEDVRFDMGAREQKEVIVPVPEREAMAVMGLEPPLVWDDIKARYRMLAKKYHPDIHGGHNPESEEILKKVNLAYSVLKIAYHKYQKLDKK